MDTLPIWGDLGERPRLRTAGGPLGRLAEDLYERTSGLPLEPWPVVTPTLFAYLDHVYSAFGQTAVHDQIVPDRPLRHATPGPLWVAFSGGKDGMAAALAARDAGWPDVRLYHVHGINRSLPDELDWASEAAEAMDMTLLVEHVAVSGRGGDFTEMPTKNQCIAALMAGRMAEQGGQWYTMGVMSADTPDTMVPSLNWSDNTAAVALWHEHLSAILPGLAFRGFLRHETESLAVIARHGLLEFAHGCMSPLRYRAQLRRANERKYGPLLSGRCGSCTKCCSEYLALFALGAVPPNDGLREHCLLYLESRMAVEHPEQPDADPAGVYVRADIVEEYRNGR